MNELLEQLRELSGGGFDQATLARPIKRMGNLTTLSQLAMNITSDAHTYSVRQVVKTMERAEQLKQAYDGDLPPEVEATFQHLTDRYLSLMEAIPQQFAVRLLAELERTAGTRRGEGVVSRLRALLED